MDNFVVSARKYRPESFDTVVGQSAITSTLKNAIQNGHLAQSFLFCGPRGVGKTSCARILARTINCMHLSENLEACGLCESCLSFKNNASYNIYELDAASNRTVDDMRSLIEQVRIPPQVGKYKVYIIDEVHMLTSEAFNAFLKTLEEPPSYAKFILATTEKHKIIPTILSRCQIFDFRRIKIGDIAQHLAFIAKQENIEADPEALHLIAQKSDGGLRDALSMFDQIISFEGNKLSYERALAMLNVLDYEYYFKLTKALLDEDIASSLNLFNEIMESGFDPQQFMGGMAGHFRNLLVLQEKTSLHLADLSESTLVKYQAQSQECGSPWLVKALILYNDCDVNYKTSNSKRLSVEILLMKLCGIKASFKQAPIAKPLSLGAKKEITASLVGQINQAAASPLANPTQPGNTLSVNPNRHANTPETANIGQDANQDRHTGQKALAGVFSLANLKKQQQGAHLEPQVQESQTKDFSASELIYFIDQFSQLNAKAHPSLVAMLQNIDYKSLVKEANQYSVKINLASEFSVKEFEEKKTIILDYLKNNLENSYIYILPEWGKNKEKKDIIPYKPEDKLKDMLEVNPELANFKSKLGLSLDY